MYIPQLQAFVNNDPALAIGIILALAIVLSGLLNGLSDRLGPR